jgi:integral membrane protein, PqiA family
MAFSKPDSLDRTLALTIAAAIVLIIANVTPMMGLSVSGRQASTTIIGGAMEMWIQGQPITALLVLFCTVVAPAIYIGIMTAILLSARRTPTPWWVGTLLKWSNLHQSWAMVEVMMLGVLVALIKIAELATVIPGIGMFAAGGLVALITAIAVSFDSHAVWQRIEWVGGETLSPLPGGQPAVLSKGASIGGGALTGMKLGLVSCESCGLLSRPADIHEPGHCPRCGEELSLRKHNAIQRTWAYIIAAFICYIPANLLPVMVSTTLGKSEDDTIISGVVLLYTTGSWPLALIVLIASVMIPLAKIIALAYLLITVQRSSIKGRNDRQRLYRLVEFVGRWSMLDMFVIAFTAALIQLKPLMSIKPGAGILFFAAVVVLTIIGAENFDPRLIWDSSNKQGSQYD